MIMSLLMKVFLTSTFLFLFLGDFTRSHFVEFIDQIHRFPEKGATRRGRKKDFLPNSSIPPGKSQKSPNSGNGKNRKPTKKSTQTSGKTGMWGR